jgi:hypothetical protein
MFCSLGVTLHCNTSPNYVCSSSFFYSPSIHSRTHSLFTLSSITPFLALFLYVISTTSCKCIIRFKAARHGFPCTGNTSLGANWHGNMSWFGGDSMFVSIGQKLHTTKHEPWNLNLKTYHPLKQVKFQRAAQHAFWCSNNLTLLNISLLKHVMFQELCFDPMHPSSMFSHVIPIHEVLNLFQLCIITMYFSTKFWCLHYRSRTRDLLKVLITKRVHGGTKETLFFHPH